MDYLIESAKRVFPKILISPNDIHSAFAGVRPLVAEGPRYSPSAVSREHKILHDETGLFTIVGGKYTTYRTMAKQMVDILIKTLRREYAIFGQKVFPSCSTDEEALVFQKNQAVAETAVDSIDAATLMHLQNRYGSRWIAVAEIAVNNPKLREAIIPGEPDILAEASYTHKHEMALSLEDFLRRRTMLALKAPLAQHLDRVDILAKAIYGNDVNYKATKEEILRLQGLDFKR